MTDHQGPVRTASVQTRNRSFKESLIRQENKVNDHRKRLIDYVELLADAKAQLKLQRELPSANLPVELVTAMDYLFSQKERQCRRIFSEAEFVGLLELQRRLDLSAEQMASHGHRNLTEVLTSTEWKSVIWFARVFADKLNNTVPAEV